MLIFNFYFLLCDIFIHHHNLVMMVRCLQRRRVKLWSGYSAPQDDQEELNERIKNMEANNSGVLNIMSEKTTLVNQKIWDDRAKIFSLIIEEVLFK